MTSKSEAALELILSDTQHRMLAALYVSGGVRTETQLMIEFGRTWGKTINALESRGLIVAGRKGFRLSPSGKARAKHEFASTPDRTRETKT